MQPTRVKRGVIGVLRKEERVLMVRRAPGIPKEGCWCFPGGHIERGETSRQALCREMKEELGLECVAGSHLGAIEVSGGYLLDVHVALCSDTSLRPAPAEIADIRWVRHEEITTISPGLPSNEQVADMLANHLIDPR